MNETDIITVKVPESEYKKAIVAWAKTEANKNGKVYINFDEWGVHVHMKSWNDGVGVNEKHWAEVVFFKLAK